MRPSRIAFARRWRSPPAAARRPSSIFMRGSSAGPWFAKAAYSCTICAPARSFVSTSRAARHAAAPDQGQPPAGQPPGARQQRRRRPHQRADRTTPPPRPDGCRPADPVGRATVVLDTIRPATRISIATATRLLQRPGGQIRRHFDEHRHGHGPAPQRRLAGSPATASSCLQVPQSHGVGRTDVKGDVIGDTAPTGGDQRRIIRRSGCRRRPC